MTYTTNAYAAMEAKAPLMPYQYEIAELEKDEVLIKVAYCGICHSDVHMIDNDWRRSSYPLVPGHEAVGHVEAIGTGVSTLKVGDAVGLGWFSGSCMHCDQCMDGRHNLCPTSEETVVSRHGGFADRVKCHQEWAIKLPEGIDMEKAGPLFCGGITVFRPIVMNNVSPMDKVGVIGIGGLGHLAIKFLVHWGCEVTAFTSQLNKADDLKAMGVHHVLDSRDTEGMKSINGSLDFLLNTANASLNWMAFAQTLAPRGKFHFVGAPPDPIELPAFALVGGEKSLSGSPLGSPYLVRKMLSFCERHDIYPDVEVFEMENANKAIDHLKQGKARYRVVLKV